MGAVGMDLQKSLCLRAFLNKKTGVVDEGSTGDAACLHFGKAFQAIFRNTRTK